ncbi:hypothetical protein DPEC_G00207880 [Dallia pectoralis]|uniref:Uncharacterized protein n=1 Tax=Dallia pectoralis TaxID=75939 RepID=A0ACC2G504_DALPE|nr:hypothetical protein DPEC_G00207880 [Dallia pectoralis]
MDMDRKISLRLASFLLAMFLATTVLSSSTTETYSTNTNTASDAPVTKVETTPTASSTPSATSLNATVETSLPTTSNNDSSDYSNGTTQSIQPDNSTTAAAQPTTSTNIQSTPSTLTPTAATTQATKTTEKLNTPSTTRPQQSTTNQPETSTTTRWTTMETHNVTKEFGLNHSEQGMTVFFSVLLGVFVLGITMFVFSRCKRMQQYSHQPLYNDVGVPLAADDTLVISGGLYDGTPVYNPTMTTTDMEDDETFDNHQRVPQPSQFRLEFFNEERDNPAYGAATFNTFQNFDD